MKFIIINGPNLNMLGTREVNIYGKLTLKEMNKQIKNKYKDIKFYFMQSNSEEEIIDVIHQLTTCKYDALIINPAAFTHYSIAILDALKCLNIVKVEVHLSDYTQREEFRRISLTKEGCDNTFLGKGIESYFEGIEYARGIVNERSKR